MQDSIIVRMMKEDFTWNPTEDLANPRYFYDEGTGARDAVKPWLEERRMVLSVQTPGWGPQDGVVGTRNKEALKIIAKYFGKYDLECKGGLSPFYGDKQNNPRLLCFLDFKTKQGAQDAAREYDDKEIEGRKIWLRPSKPAPYRAHQIGKIDQIVLAELQSRGIAPQETYEDKFNTPKQKANGKKKQSTLQEKSV